MTCPNCNTPNPPEALYCENCNVLLPSPAELRRLKRIRIAKAVTVAVILPLFYFLVMNTVGLVWVVRFAASLPSGISKAEYDELSTAAFNSASVYLNIIASGISLLTIAVYFAMKRRSLADAANIRHAPPVKMGAAFVAGLTAQLPAGLLLALIPFSEEMVENHNELMAASTAPLWVQMLYAVILAPVIEEIFFRGIAHDRLAKAMPVPVAAVISALGFAVIHMEILSVTVAFICGVIFALMYSKFRTVMVTIPFHMGFNLCSYAVSFVEDPVLFFALAIASLLLFVGSMYLLFKKDKPAE